MPTVGFVGVKVTSEDRAMAARIHAEASDHSKKATREILQLKSFMDANTFSADRNPKHEILLLFAAQFLNSGRAGSTLNGLLDDLVKFQVDPFDIEPAIERVRMFHVRNAVQRIAKTEKRRFERTPLDAYNLPDEEPSDLKEAERWAFWALLMVTGNRPNNVLRVRTLDVEEGGRGVAVHWGMRKVHSNTRVRYSFSWTVVPPTWVLDRWRRLTQQPWAFTSPTSIASSVNKWLDRWGIGHFTSTSPRGALDDVLRQFVVDKVINETVYERIIDHKLSTGFDHYSAGAINDTPVKLHRTENP
jgi:integrase